MPIVPESWMPNCAMKRVICHWTAGSHDASSLDRKHYHIMIEGDGNLVRGAHSIEANVNTGDRVYAAHTGRMNTGSIGVSVCCMANARERPFDAGRFPMTRKQWNVMAQVVADLCRQYQIEVGPTTVLGHGEVEANLGVAQRGKWDPMVLPWDPGMSKTAVGDAFRSLVSGSMARGDAWDDEAIPTVRVAVEGKIIEAGIVDNEQTFVPVAELCQTLGWTLLNAAVECVVLQAHDGAGVLYLPYELRDDVDVPPDAAESELADRVLAAGYVDVRDLGRELESPVEWDEENDVVVVGHPAGESRPESSGAAPRLHTVQPDDTLAGIAALFLGSGRRWRELRKADGTPFTEREARRLRVGAVVRIPSDEAAPPEPSPGAGPARPPSPPRAVLDVDALVNVAPSTVRQYAQGSIPILVAECRSSGVTNPAQIAYVLATSQHESQCGKFMRELWGPTRHQRRYEGREDLGNTQPGDGFRFRGRGFVQVTGRVNYEDWSRRLDIDLASNPDIVETDLDIAARIIVEGMLDGTFRPPHKLDRHIGDSQRSFFDAREIINADKHLVDPGHGASRGQRIADIAEAYFLVLRG